MRVVLVTATFRARAPFDLGSHVRSLAPALARSGAEVEVFSSVGGDSGLAPFAQRRVEVIDHVSGLGFGVTTCAIQAPAEPVPQDGEDAPGTTPESARGSGGGHTEGWVAQPGFHDRVAEEFGAFLDRERPQIVHFESLDVFGTQLVREAKARGIKTVYCASDTWPAHDSSQLLLPDLQPFELGDGEAEARGILALQEFRRGAIDSGELSASESARLNHLLHEPLTSLDDVARLRDAAESVELRRAAKRIALSAVDRRFATTRLLAKNLSASVGRAFTFRATGLDTGLFQSPEARIQPADPLRFVYFGTTARDSGIDVLLGAFGVLRSQAIASSEPGAEADTSNEPQLVLMLECQDADRDAEVAARAQELRIETRWTRGPSDVVGGLSTSDVVVVPSLWGEASPTVCRVAFATAHPVLASRTPGIAEGAPSMASMLITPGDVAALAEAIQKLCSGKAEMDTMVAGAFEAARSTKSIEDEAREWLDTYAQLLSTPAPIESKSSATPKDALSETRELLGELQGLSMTELFARAQEGVGKLRRAFGLADTDAELLARVVARGGLERDRAAGERRLRRELEETLESLRAARDRMGLEEAARARRVADLHGVLGQYESEVLARKDQTSRAVEAAVAAAKAEVQSEVQAEANRVAQEEAQAVARAAQEEAETAVRKAEQAAEEAASKALVAAEKAEAEARAAVESAEADAKEKVASAVADAATAQAKSAAAQKELAAKADALEASQEALKELQGRADRLEAEQAAAAAESEATQKQLAALEEEIISARAAIDETEEERSRMAKSLDERDAMVRELRHSLGAEGEAEAEASDLRGELSSIEAFCVRLERDTEELKRHDAWMQEQTTRLVSMLVPASDLAGTGVQGGRDKEGVVDGLERGLAVLERLRSELDWRRSEMASAREASASVRLKLLAGPLAARVRGWGSAESSRWAPVPVDRTESLAAPASSGTGSSETGSSETEPLEADAGAEGPGAPLPSASEPEAAAADGEGPEGNANGDSETTDQKPSEASAS